MAALRFEFDGEELTLEPILNKFQDPNEAVRRRASDALAKTFRANLRTFSLITNTLAKDKKFRIAGAASPILRIHAISQTASSVKSSMRSLKRFKPPIRACRIAITS